MPREITKHKTILEAVGSVEILSDLLAERDGRPVHEIDLEVFAYGRNYNGKKVGPYVRLLTFQPGEEVVREGDWGGNTFYITVDATLDVFVRDPSGGERRVGEVPAGVSFGEMALLAGVPRNATVRVPAGVAEARVLEITRPALRLLRKLPKFGNRLDAAYRKHGLGRTLAELAQASGGALGDELLARLGKAARFVVYGKHHVLFREGERVDRLIFIRDGWVRRVGGHKYTPGTGETIAAALDPSAGMDFLGAGNCLGLEGLGGEARWRYTATIPQRTEALEISIRHARADEELRREIARAFSGFSHADDEPAPAPGDRRALAAAEREITTGLADATNLLVMDMDLCVRCGNCSLACHEVHGRSRLLRRGIHVERPVQIEGRRTQHVLTPSVCIHCQDPECLTGCPTGAIGRFGGGYIDIDPQTCIGCGDCATQCPYNAVSMVPRRAATPPPRSAGDRLKSLFSLKPPRPPEPVTETEGLLAAKCNLCNNTPLNPPGARSHKYSCEENCPTGALVRVNPREYFDEVGRTLGLVYKDRAHAVGRNIHRRDPAARLWHALGILSTVAVTLLFARVIVARGLDGPLWDGTWLTARWLTGLVGLVGVAGVMTYPARKQVYRRRAGALRYWLLAHVYLGVIAGVVLLMHGGSTTGGLLTSLLMVSFDAVIVTGLFGLACYALVPRVMTSMEGEPLLVDDLKARRAELREKLAEIGSQSDERVRDFIRRRVRRRYFSLRFLLRQYARREELTALLARARERTERAARDLGDERAHRLLVEAVETAIVLRRIDALIYAHQLLKLWLAPHVVTTSLMLALMAAHVVQVVFFAAG